jgi:hypothetical protein
MEVVGQYANGCRRVAEPAAAATGCWSGACRQCAAKCLTWRFGTLAAASGGVLMGSPGRRLNRPVRPSGRCPRPGSMRSAARSAREAGPGDGPMDGGGEARVTRQVPGERASPTGPADGVTCEAPARSDQANRHRQSASSAAGPPGAPCVRRDAAPGPAARGTVHRDGWRRQRGRKPLRRPRSCPRRAGTSSGPWPRESRVPGTSGQLWSGRGWRIWPPPPRQGFVAASLPGDFWSCSNGAPQR